MSLRKWHQPLEWISPAAVQRCSYENIQQFYRRISMPKCNLNKVALQLYWSHASAWVFSYKFAAYFQNNFSQEHLWVAVPCHCNKKSLFFLEWIIFSKFFVLEHYLCIFIKNNITGLNNLWPTERSFLGQSDI